MDYDYAVLYYVRQIGWRAAPMNIEQPVVDRQTKTVRLKWPKTYAQAVESVAGIMAAVTERPVTDSLRNLAALLVSEAMDYRESIRDDKIQASR